MRRNTTGIKTGDTVEWTNAEGADAKSGTVANVRAYSLDVEVGDKGYFVPCCLIRDVTPCRTNIG